MELLLNYYLLMQFDRKNLAKPWVHQEKTKRVPDGKKFGNHSWAPSTPPLEHAQFQGNKQGSLEPEWSIPVVWENWERDSVN